MSALNPVVIYSLPQMKEKYGAFYDAGQRLALRPSKVPAAVRPLLPYAEFWGLADDYAREALVGKAPKAVLKNLKGALALHAAQLDAWLAGPEADGKPSKEYVAFSALRMAADFAP